MFKKLIPVIALALIAGPVLAADPPAGSTDQSTASSTKSSHKKSHSKKHKGSKSTDTSTSSSAPK